MSASAAIADSQLRLACRRAGSPLDRSTSCSRMPSSLTAPRVRLALRLRNFATNRHESCGLAGCSERPPSGVLGRTSPCDVWEIKRDYWWSISVRQEYLSRRTGQTKFGMYLLSRRTPCGLVIWRFDHSMGNHRQSHPRKRRLRGERNVARNRVRGIR